MESIEHGAFTYALVEALKKQTIPDQLERDLCQRVKELNDSVKIGRKQRPVIRIEPVARASFPLLRDFVTEADLEVLQKRAWKAECLEDLDTAEQLWWKINDIPSSRSLRGEARESLQRIGQKRLFRSRVEQDLQLANRELNELRQQQQTWGHAAKKLTQLQNEKDLIVQELQTLEQHQIQLQQEKAELERQLAQAQASAEQELSLRQQQWQAETAKQLQQVQDSAQAKINQLNTALEQLQRQLEAQKTRERQASPATVSAGNSKTDLSNTSFNLPNQGGTLEFIAVPGGTLRMEGGHQVNLQPFLMGKHPVTQRQYQAVMGENPSYFEGDLDRPVEKVNWHEAIAFCKKLSEILKQDIDLPSETQWEWAARGATKSQGFEYAGSNNLDEVGWYGDNSEKTTHPVGQKKPNELGMYDLSGNVWEWCKDNYGDVKDLPVDGSPLTNGGYSNRRLLRGGSWVNLAGGCRSAFRGGYTHIFRVNGFGFRVVCRSSRTL